MLLFRLQAVRQPVASKCITVTGETVENYGCEKTAKRTMQHNGRVQCIQNQAFTPPWNSILDAYNVNSFQVGMHG